MKRLLTLALMLVGLSWYNAQQTGCTGDDPNCPPGATGTLRDNCYYLGD